MFPGAIDDITTLPVVSNGQTITSAESNNQSDAIKAAEAAIGVTGTLVTTSLRYILTNTTGGHRHTGSDSRPVTYTDLASIPSTFAPSSHGQSAHTGDILPDGSDQTLAAGSISIAQRTLAGVSTPASGTRTIFVDSADGKLKVKNSAGLGVSLEEQGGGGSGAPLGATYLVTTADASLTSEVVVGLTPGGELGGAWDAFTVDAVHSGTAHHGQVHGLADHNTGSARIGVGLDSAKGVVGTSDRLWFATDIGVLYRDTGAAWLEMARSEAFTRLASLSEKSHASLTSVTANQHHNQVHLFWGTDHSDVFAADTKVDGDVVTWVAANSRFELVQPSAGGTGHTIQEDGTSLTARTSLNFVAGVIATDTGTKTEINLDYGTTTQLADVGITELAGTSAKVARADHVHAHGTGKNVDDHHTENHDDTKHSGASRHTIQVGGTPAGTQVTTNFVGGDAISLVGSLVGSVSTVTVHSIPQVITLVAHSNTWNTMPAALTEFLGSPGRRTKLDLSRGVVSARIVVNMGATGGTASAQLRIQYSLDQSTWAYLDATSGPQVGINASNQAVSGAWVAVTAAAKADVFIRIVGINGTGVAGDSPIVTGVQLQVK